MLFYKYELILRLSYLKLVNWTFIQIKVNKLEKWMFTSRMPNVWQVESWWHAKLLFFGIFYLFIFTKFTKFIKSSTAWKKLEINWRSRPQKDSLQDQGYQNFLFKIQAPKEGWGLDIFIYTVLSYEHYRPLGKAVHWAPTYTTTHRNKNVKFDKIKYIYWSSNKISV